MTTESLHLNFRVRALTIWFARYQSRRPYLERNMKILLAVVFLITGYSNSIYGLFWRPSQLGQFVTELYVVKLHTSNWLLYTEWLIDFRFLTAGVPTVSLACLFFIVADMCHGRCPPPQWLVRGGSCYTLSTWFGVAKMNFTNSRIYCQSQGGDLFILEQLQEIDTLKEYLQ